MKVKKIATALLSLCVAVCFVCVPAYSATVEFNPITPFYQYTVSATSKLTISSNGTATCTSELIGGNSVTRIVGNQYLQRYEYRGSGWQWYTVSGGSWSKSVNDYDLYMSNTKSSLASGTYRLRTVFTVYSGNKFETVEKISATVTR